MKNKKHNFIIFAGLCIFCSLLSCFLPFLNVEDCRPVSGAQLCFFLYRRFALLPADGGSGQLYFLSRSLWLAAAFVALLSAGVLLCVPKSRKSPVGLAFAALATAAGAVCYAAQLGGGAELYEFFGVLGKAAKQGGQTVYSIPQGVKSAIGIGTRLLAVCLPCAFVSTLAAAAAARGETGRANPTLRRLRANRAALGALGVLAVLGTACFFGPVFCRGSLLGESLTNALLAPSLTHWLGTDGLGRDLFTRLLYGGRVSLSVALCTVAVEIALGTTVGCLAGLLGGWVDALLMRVTDAFLCLPLVPTVIIVAALLSAAGVDPALRIGYVVLVLALFFWPSVARVVRSGVLALRRQDFIRAAKGQGFGPLALVFRELLPNLAPVLITAAALDFGNVILAESGLSFLGLGVAPPYPSWGNIIGAVADPNQLTLRPWLWVPAGVCILVTVLAVNIFGDALRDAISPAARPARRRLLRVQRHSS